MKYYDKIILEVDSDPRSMFIFGMIGLKERGIKVFPRASEDLKKELTPSSILIRFELCKWEGGEDDMRPDYEVIQGIGRNATPDDFNLYFRLGTGENGLYYRGWIEDAPQMDFSYPAYIVRLWEDDFLDASGEMDMDMIRHFQNYAEHRFLDYLDDRQDTFGYMIENMPLIMRHKAEILSRPELFRIPLGVPKSMYYGNELDSLGEFLYLSSIPELSEDAFLKGESYKGWPIYVDSMALDSSGDECTCEPTTIVLWVPELNMALEKDVAEELSSWMKKYWDLTCSDAIMWNTSIKKHMIWSIGKLVAALKDLEAGKSVILPYKSEELVLAMKDIR